MLLIIGRAKSCNGLFLSQSVWQVKAFFLVINVWAPLQKTKSFFSQFNPHSQFLHMKFAGVFSTMRKATKTQEYMPEKKKTWSLPFCLKRPFWDHFGSFNSPWKPFLASHIKFGKLFYHWQAHKNPRTPTWTDTQSFVFWFVAAILASIWPLSEVLSKEIQTPKPFLASHVKFGVLICFIVRLY